MTKECYLKAKEIYIVGSDGCAGLSVTKKEFTTQPLNRNIKCC